MSKLDKDILFLTFEELRDDSKSLFSCVMVNRLWCVTGIPVLWRNPWSYDIKYNKKKYLFVIIASYLSDNAKESLMKDGIQLPSFSYQSLLFDYLSFCRSINTDTIKSITSIGTSLAYKRYLLEQEFYHVFMKKFPELKYLDMKSTRHQLFHYPEARLRFESLCELKCDTSIESSYFYRLAQLCQYIQRLIIANIKANDYHGIAELIGVQKNLKYFEWRDVEYLSYIPGPDRYKEILFALEKSADTINHLNIYFIYIDGTSSKVLPKFHKLKTLKVSFYYFSEEHLKMCVYHDLENFEIDSYELKAASTIIENTGGHLKKIFLESYELDRHNEVIEDLDDYSLIFIRNVYEKCISIEYLSLIFPPSKQHFNEFEKLLKICQNVKSLLLAIYLNSCEAPFENKDRLENGKELLKLLVRSAPTNLREIRFLYDVEFSLDALEEFFEKWRGRPALSILTPDYIYEGEDYKKLISKYKNDGVIKDFSYESFEDVVNMDFKI